MNRTLASIVGCALAGTQSACAAHAVAGPPVEWTVMVFMNGDNNLEPYALADLREMSRVGSSDKVKIVAQVDRAPAGRYTPSSPANPHWSQTLRFLVGKDMRPTPANAVADLGELNMGSPDVLADFVRWARATYPAKRYALVIWDHGQGWRGITPMSRYGKTVYTIESQTEPELDTRRSTTAAGLLSVPSESFVVTGGPFRSSVESPTRSVSHDETDADELYNAEVHSGTRAALGADRLDVLGFDACLMAMVESAYAFRDLADYMVASQDLEPGDGWRYDAWLSMLAARPSMDGAQLARSVVSAYETEYGPRWPHDTTLSAIDLRKVAPAAQAITALADGLLPVLPQELAHVSAARAQVANFAPDPHHDGQDYFYHIDFVRFAEQYALRTTNATTRQLAEQARDAVRGAVVANYAGENRRDRFGGNGLAIYFPATGYDYRHDIYATNGYERDNTHHPVAFVVDHRWADFLHGYFAHVP